MDPITIVLVAAGAALLSVGIASGSTWSMVVLTGGFYGIHRIVRSRATAVAVFAPLAKWAFARFFSPLPTGFAHRIEAQSPTLALVPASIGTLALFAGLAITVIVARARIGRFLSGLTVGALALGFLMGCLAHLPEKASTPNLILDAMERGYESAGIFLAGACWVSLLLAPKTDAPRGGIGHILGAVGAVLLSALVQGVSPAGSSGPIMAVFLLTAVVGWILCAVGVGAATRTGGGWAGWVGLGLVVLQILSLPAAIALYPQQVHTVITMATGFGALGIALGALGARTYPLREIRYVVGGLFLVAFSGAMLAWTTRLAAEARILRGEDSPSVALQTPAFTVGLLVWAVVLALKASPPDVEEAR